MSQPTSNMIYKIFKFYLKSWNRGRCINKNFDWNARGSTRFTEKNSLEFYGVLERNHTRRYRRDPRYVSIEARFACGERSGRCDFETVAIKRPVNNDTSYSSFHFHPSFSMSLLPAVRWHLRGEQEISSSLYCVERPRGTYAIYTTIWKQGWSSSIWLASSPIPSLRPEAPLRLCVYGASPVFLYIMRAADRTPEALESSLRSSKSTYDCFALECEYAFATSPVKAD